MNKNQINHWNKIVLGSFLCLIAVTIIMKVVITIFMDLGFSHGRFHIGFWKDPQLAFAKEFSEFKAKFGNTATWNFFLSVNTDIKTILKEHPNFFWTYTQFTWLTTFMLFFFVLFRLFKFQSKLPKWFRWIMSQKTLSLITIYDIVLGIVFWGGIFADFKKSFTGSLMIPQIIVTVLVHAIIPILITTYSIIFLVRDQEASILRARFGLKSMIFPTVYLCIYIILTVIWSDPYPITNMQERLVNPVDNHINWANWAEQLWKPILVLTFFYVAIGVCMMAHNLILINHNKKYNPFLDHDALLNRHRDELILKKKLLKIIYPKNWQKQYKIIKVSFNKKRQNR